MIAVPVIYPLTDGMNERTFQEIVFRYGVMIVTVFFVRNLWLALFFCWTLFLYYLNGGSCGYETVLNVYLGIMLYGTSRYLYGKFKFDKECRWLLWVGLISLIFMVFQYFCIDPIHIKMSNEGVLYPYGKYNDMSGIFFIKAHNGIFLALLSPILAVIHPILGILMLLPLKFSESSGAVLAGGCSLLFFLWFDKRKLNFFRISMRWFYIVLILGVLGMGVFFLKDYKKDPKMYGSRFSIWHLTLKQSLLRPIGYGPDSFRNVTSHKDFLIMGDQDFHPAIGLTTAKKEELNFVYYSPDPSKIKDVNNKDTGYKFKNSIMWDHPHNEYLNLLFCWGLVGFGIFCMFARDEILAFIKADKTTEVVLIASLILIYALSSLVQFPLSVARLGYLFPIILGAFAAATRPD